ncbi:heme peroxidase [Mycena alexandri]|uniref:Peroxidase n=1 Tax=Mycena alexandri TaxID=1745969 RepID=A0AAD6SRW4_9AGAR|nr:heme peroxidase [Mycena alexandri]
MRSLSLFIVALLGTSVHGIPQVVPASGGPSGSGGSGKPPPTTAGDGIPLVANAKNPVCVPWYAIRDAIMGGLFQGRCTDNARAAVRLAFHDAGTFSLALRAAGLPNGGADGSMLSDPTEVNRSENNGLQTIVGLLQPLVTKFNVAPGDVLHLAGALGVLACPGGPVVPVFVGRHLPLNIAPQGLLPSPEDPVDKLVARFADMGLTIRQMIALIGAHTTGRQRFVNTAVAGNSFDSTINIWDTRFYTETLATGLLPGQFKLDSDVKFATNITTATEFTRFIGHQDLWITDYAGAHEQMSILGQDTTTLTDCSEILPLSISLTPLEIGTTGGGGGGGGGGEGGVAPASNKPVTDPPIDPTLLEAAIEKFRDIWLVPAA